MTGFRQIDPDDVLTLNGVTVNGWQLAEARQQLAHEGCFLDRWDQLNEYDQEMAALAAGNYLRALAKLLPDHAPAERRARVTEDLCRAVAARLESRTTYTNLGTDTVDGSLEEVIRAVIAELERPGSGLCDCREPDRDGSLPTNPSTGAEMDHHCECPAVTVTATLLGAYSKTTHAQQCVHGAELDEFYRRETS